MQHTIAFYVHHHGSGHLMRTLEIAKHLSDYRVVIMGSALKTNRNSVAKHIEWVDLPMDTVQPSDEYYSEGTVVDGLHYAPLNIEGIRTRSEILTAVFKQYFPMVLIVDVSVEVTLFARLCGIPTLVMRQHGNRTDLPHHLTYQSATHLIAPFGADLETCTSSWITEKTFYTGGFSRFPRTKQDELLGTTQQICILTGIGGTSINLEVIRIIAQQCSAMKFHVLGEVTGSQISQLPNVIFYGRVAEVEKILEQCSLIIGNTGHNTVMEIAALNKRFIGIPEQRPFDEQIDKATALKGTPGFVSVLPEEISNTNWQTLITKLLQTNSSLSELINEDALPRLVDELHRICTTLYPKRI